MWVVARMEWRERSRYTMMRWFVYGLAALAALLSFAEHIDPEPMATTRRVGVVGALPTGLVDLLDAPPKLTINFVTEPDRRAAEAGVRSGRVAAAVVDGTVLARSRPSSPIVVLLQRALPRAQVAERLQSAGVGHDEAIALGALPPAPVAVLSAPSARRTANVELARVGAVGGSALVFFLVLFISTGVQEERGRRIADVVLVPLNAVEVLAGKVVGVEGFGLTVLARVAAPPAAIALAFEGIHVVGQVLLTAVAVVLWFVLELALYACVAVVTGARSPSPEEAGVWSMPVAMVVSFAAAAAAGLVPTSPGGVIATVGSFLPPTAAPFMLVRAAAGTVAPWQVIGAASVMLVAIVFTAWLAAWLYVGGVVLAGDKLRLRDVYWIRSGRPPPKPPPGPDESGLPSPVGDGDRAGGSVPTGTDAAAPTRGRP